MATKINKETYDEKVETILAYSRGEEGGKKRNFQETIEIQIMLKGYDPSKDKRFNGSVKLPFPARPNMKICILADAKHMDMAKDAGVACKSVEELKKLNKNKKLVKKLAQEYDAFFASSTIIKQIPRILGPGLNKAGKFPGLLSHDDSISGKISELQSTIKFQMKKVLTLGTAIGNVSMDKEDIVQNAITAVNFFVSLLKKNWQNIKSLNLKSTMGPAQRLY
jgi:large subunit ribosomal protein L10Ae